MSTFLLWTIQNSTRARVSGGGGPHAVWKNTMRGGPAPPRTRRRRAHPVWKSIMREGKSGAAYAAPGPALRGKTQCAEGRRRRVRGRGGPILWKNTMREGQWRRVRGAGARPVLNNTMRGGLAPPRTRRRRAHPVWKNTMREV